MKMKTRDMILVALFAALMVVGAFIKIPLPVVTLTFQPFFCALAGIILGSRLGALSQFVYMLLGLVGVPVFSQGGGPMYALKPSFGYIIGFVAAAYIIGRVSEALKEMNLKNTLISVLSGLIVIYLIGVPYMYLIVNFYVKKPMTLWAALAAGFFPFIVKDLVLYVVVAVIACQVVPVLRKAGLITAAVK